MHIAMRRSPFNSFFAYQVLILLLLCNASASTKAQPGFLSLDCGGPATYTDRNDISWIPDSEEYVRTGLSVTINANVPNLTTLRKFTNNLSKNCYTLPTKPSTRYLIRATFLYLNYDGAITNPMFGLSLDASMWATINIINSTHTYFEEIIALAQSTSFSVCLLNTNQGTPFINSLELRPLVGGMYGLPYMNDAYLSQKLRVNYGAPTLAPVRYPADPVDRIWVSDKVAAAQNGVLQTQSPHVRNLSTTHHVDVNGATDLPPESVMQTAVVGGSGKLSYRTTLMGFPNQAYAVTYFAEIQDLKPTDTRSFSFMLDANDPTFVSQPLDIQRDAGGPYRSFEPGYDNVTFPELLDFSLNKDTNSTLNPIMNAVEIYEIVSKVSPTDPRDVSALMAFSNQLPPEKFQGDPCLPLPWSWVTCNGMSPPRVTSIELSNANLSGQVPTSLFSMTSLQGIYLDSNALTGPIPDLSSLTSLQILHLQNNHLSEAFPQSLANLPSLKELWVENNNLMGTVPVILLNKQGLNTRFSGNPYLCSNVTCIVTVSPKSTLSAILLALGIAGSVALALLIVGVLAAFLFHRRIFQQRSPLSGGSNKTSLIGGVAASVSETTSEGLTSFNELRTSPPEPVAGDGSARNFTPARNFHLPELKFATKNFTTKIGEGGFGPVFYGKTKDEQELAVKVLAGDSRQGAREFYTEVSMLSRVHHRNLVALIGYCHEAKERVVVYEYMPKGSLSDHLHGPFTVSEPLDWLTRLNIALDAAKGVEYLHTGCNPSIIHRDVKSSNVLLTNKMEAKVSDFGLSKLSSESINQISSTIQGTVGYLDPEYYQSQQLTKKSDVYSFGVVLLELISGREPLGQKRKDFSLVNWARSLLQTGDLDGIVDPALEQNYSLEAMWKFAELAILSVEPMSYHRPEMSDVVKEITDVIRLETRSSGGSSKAMSKAPSFASPPLPPGFHPDLFEDDIGTGLYPLNSAELSRSFAAPSVR